ncbi:hypothetical protein GCM10022252_32470 [Streptosporangium oxazolinicum]|uniref:Phosphate ABC transporter substrate-binding protein n=1 Tax=Streptosporangium oxazolinicum TaxID=909287 RepID=A0ABP8AW02_9ACTN
MAEKNVTFVLDKNLGLPTDQEPLKGILTAAGVTAEATTDLVAIDERLAGDGPDIAYVPGADFCRLMLQGNQAYLGLVIATSKFTGEPGQRTLLVVRRDDPASGIGDLAGAEYGYMNESCSSSYFPPAILLNKMGERLDEFFTMKEVAGWQERVDAVVSREIRATMILQDVWKMTPRNPENAKVIGEYAPSPPAILVVRKELDGRVVSALREHLLLWRPDWRNIYGAFRPYCFADVQTFYHDLGELPADIRSPRSFDHR